MTWKKIGKASWQKGETAIMVVKKGNFYVVGSGKVVRESDKFPRVDISAQQFSEKKDAMKYAKSFMKSH